MSARIFLCRGGIRPVSPGGLAIVGPLVSRATPPNPGTVHSPFTFAPTEPPRGSSFLQVCAAGLGGECVGVGVCAGDDRGNGAWPAPRRNDPDDACCRCMGAGPHASPLIRLPSPTGATMVSKEAAAVSSWAIVAAPSARAVSTPSTRSNASSAAAAACRACSPPPVTSTTWAPKASILSRLTGLSGVGAYTRTRAPRARPTNATACPKFPYDAHTTRSPAVTFRSA